MLYRHREVAGRRIETRQTHDASSGPLVRRRAPKELAVINDRRHVEPRDRVRMMNERKQTARPAEQIRIRAQRTEWNRHVRILQDEIAPGHKGREVARAGRRQRVAKPGRDRAVRIVPSRVGIHIQASRDRRRHRWHRRAREQGRQDKTQHSGNPPAQGDPG
jgi:hypothetical protein